MEQQRFKDQTFIPRQHHPLFHVNKPMGRNVIFYFYPGNYTTGNSVGMKALMVTTSSSDTQTSNNNQTQTTADTNNTASQQTTTASQGADTQSSDDS